MIQDQLTLDETKEKVTPNNLPNQGGLWCEKCGQEFPKEAVTITDVPFGAGKFHRKATCPECGHFITFLPYSEPMMRFGMYKGQLVKDIVKTKDGKRYLQWIMAEYEKGNFSLKTRIKDAIKEALTE